MDGLRTERCQDNKIGGQYCGRTVLWEDSRLDGNPDWEDRRGQGQKVLRTRGWEYIV